MLDSSKLILFTAFPQIDLMIETRDDSMGSEENVRKVGSKISFFIYISIFN